MVNLPTNGRDPFHANRQCRLDRDLDRRVRALFKVHGTKNRKRKKHVYKVERAHYRALLLDVAVAMAAEADQWELRA